MTNTTDKSNGKNITDSLDNIIVIDEKFCNVLKELNIKAKDNPTDVYAKMNLQQYAEDLYNMYKIPKHWQIDFNTCRAFKP